MRTSRAKPSPAKVGAKPVATVRGPADLPFGPARMLALQRSTGNRAVVRYLQRSFRADGKGGWLLTFTAGTEINVALAAEAYRRTASGPLTGDDLPPLRELALAADRTVDDNERMFIAALLDPANAAKLHTTNPGGFGSGAGVTFDGATITSDNRDLVRDVGRDPGQGRTAMQIGKKPTGPGGQIIELAGTAFAATAQQVLALAKQDKLPVKQVYQAMLAAASDSTAGDRVLAGAAYVIARRAKLPVAADLLAGNIKVDEVPPASITGTAMYVTTSTLEFKGDTIYLPTTFDVTSIAYQGLLVHELTHAAGDRAANSLTTVDGFRFELDGYRARPATG